MYVDQMRTFIDAVASGRPLDDLNLDHAVKIQEVLVKARENAGQRPFELG